MSKQIGRHHVSCASIESPVVDELLAGVKAQLFFSDPPWGDGNLKYWATMNKKMTGANHTAISYEALLDRIIDLVNNHVHGHIMILTGIRWAEHVTDRFDGCFHNIEIIRLDYKAGSKILPCSLVYAQTHPIAVPHIAPKATRGYPCVRELVATVTRPEDVVIDPCCGMGYTAQACVDLGLTFYGNEFNEKRLEKTIKRLQ